MKAFMMITIFLSITLACGNRSRGSDYRFSNSSDCRDFFDSIINCLRSVNTSMSKRDIENELLDCQDQNSYNNTNYNNNFNNISNRNFNTNSNRGYTSSSTNYRTLQNQCYDERNINEWIRCMEEEAYDERDDCR